MTQTTQQAAIARRRVVFQLPGMDGLTVQRSYPYATACDPARTLDLYQPAGGDSTSLRPAVIFVTGYADAGFERILGCKAKDMSQYQDWAKLVAASGMVGVTYGNVEPAGDALRVVEFIRDHAAELCIDPSRVAIWSCSGNVPNALALLGTSAPLRPACALLAYGFMLDLDGETGVAAGSKAFGFVTPLAGRGIEALCDDVPMLIVRAGKDDASINASIDRFAAHALTRNLPMTLENAPDLPHAFDSIEGLPEAKQVVQRMLRFLRERVLN